MSVYICHKCGCIENTACEGTYWLVTFNKVEKRKIFTDDWFNEHPVCTECTPVFRADGTINRLAGKWHGRFPKQHWSEFGTKEDLLKSGSFIEAELFFEEMT